MKIAKRIQLAFLIVAFLATSVLACQVPVFRYALERWNADRYEVIILHDAELSEASLSLVYKLQTPKLIAFTNYQMQLRHIKDVRDARLKELWEKRLNSEVPLMVVLYPRTATEVADRVVDVKALSESSVEGLLRSPVRNEVAKRLSSGQSAVWIFVPSGHDSADSVAVKLLADRMALNASRLTVPTAEELEVEPLVLAKSKIPLRIEFSMLKLDRDDPREAFLLNALMKSEPDLDASKPMVFPVFGRGRVLYGLVGDGIMAETIDTACQFMSGPCSCQVKNQNPGFDLLISKNWDDAVAGSMLSSPLPDESAQPRLLSIPPGQRPKP